MQMLGLGSGLKPMAIMPDVKVCPADAVRPLQCSDIGQSKCHLACRASFAMLYLPCWLFWPLASTETNNTPAYHIGRPTRRLYVRSPCI